MSNILPELGGIAANTVGETVAYAAGTAGHTALSPVAEAIAQVAWGTSPIRLPVAEYLALGVAQGKVDAKTAAEWAKRQGYDTGPWDAMVSIAAVAPALGYGFQAWRRGDLTDAQFTELMQRAGIAAEWFPALEALKADRLDLGAIATAVHRNIMQGQGLIVTEAPTAPGNVPMIPQSAIDPVTEAAAHGIDQERLRILIADTGLPLSLGEMLQLKNRGEVTDDDVKRAVAESNIRNEYMDVALALARRLLTPREYAEAELRGVLPHDQAQAGAGLSGLDAADYVTLFETVGRPLPVHAITTGLARGGTYGGTYTDVPEPYQDAIRRSNIRPEYAVLAYANRYTYSVPFWWRAMATASEFGDLDPEQLLLDIGNPPEFAKQIVSVLVGTQTAKGDAHVTKAETQLWNTIHKSYVDDEADQAKATEALAKVGVAEASIGQVLSLWDEERSIVRAALTPSQIKKAIGQPGKDTAWATQRLLERGYSSEDAATFLAE